MTFLFVASQLWREIVVDDAGGMSFRLCGLMRFVHFTTHFAGFLSTAGRPKPQLPSPFTSLTKKHLAYCLLNESRFRTGDLADLSVDFTPQAHAHVGRTMNASRRSRVVEMGLNRGGPVMPVVMWQKHPDEAACRGAAVKLNGGSKGRRNGNIARDVRSASQRSVALYGSGDPIFPTPKANQCPFPWHLKLSRNSGGNSRACAKITSITSCSSVGAETEAGPMIYEGPTTPEEIYGPRDELADILLLGDDFQGYCFGYNSITGCYGEVSNSGSWEPWPPSAGFARYISGPSENAT